MAWVGIRLSFLVLMDVNGTSEFYVPAPSLCKLTLVSSQVPTHYILSVHIVISKVLSLPVN